MYILGEIFAIYWIVVFDKVHLSYAPHQSFYRRMEQPTPPPYDFLHILISDIAKFHNFFLENMSNYFWKSAYIVYLESKSKFKCPKMDENNNTNVFRALNKDTILAVVAQDTKSEVKLLNRYITY